MIDRDRLGKLLERERSSYRERHPRSRAAYQAAAASLLGSVPMTWMNMTAGGFPVALAEARGARLTDLDGHEYLDLCLGDTAAMAGHSPEPVVRAVERRYGRAGGATAMLPTEDAAWVGAELGLLLELLRPGGALHLVYETPAAERAAQVAEAVTGALARRGSRPR